MTHSTAVESLEELLGLRWPAVAVGFLAEAPADIPREATPALSGCTFWRRAAEGRAFYTLAPDHMGCPIGSHTHNIELSDEKKEELSGLVSTMLSLEYLREEEVQALPRRSAPFQIAAYAPLADASFTPDVVLVRGDAKQMMLLFEACQSLGIAGDWSGMGRPTCAVIPHALESGEVTLSVGCIGNRVYTDLEDAELYCAVPSGRLADLLEKLSVIRRANQELEAFHRGR